MRTPPIRLAVVAIMAAVTSAVSPALGADDPLQEALRAVHRAAKDRDPGPLADAVYALRRHESPEAARTLIAAALRTEVHDIVRDAAMDALGRWESDGVADLVLAELDRARKERRLLLLEAVSRLPNPRAEIALLGFVEDEDPRVRAAAVLGLGGREKPGLDARVALERAAVDPDPGVRSAALAMLAGRHDLENGLPLLLAMGRERGRLFGDAWLGLRRISGERLPPDPQRCADWWRTLPDEKEWDFDRKPEEAPLPSLDLRGLVSFSRRIVFVLDLSEGMRDAPGYRASELVPEDVREGPREILESWLAIKTRLDHARCHLARAIRALPADVSFDVVHGAESANALFRKLVPATADNREKAARRLDGLSASNRQDMYGLLRLALSLPGSSPSDVEAFRDGADTIVYVGTALPTFGAEVDTRRLVSTFRRWNRTRQVVFLGLGVGNHGSDLLSDLSEVVPRGAHSAIP